MSNIGVLIPIIALMIPIVAIVMSHWSKVRNRQLDIIERGGFNMGEEAEAKMAKLEARVAVLERIATDKRLTLADEINQLKG
jgi:hypothetical protein